MNEKMRLIDFKSMHWSLRLPRKRTVTAIRNETAEVTGPFEERVRSAKQEELDDIDLAFISGESLKEGPIQALPPEMLGEIFCQYVESNISPWVLVKVCRHWMQIALGTPRLWGRILFINEPEVTMGQSYIFEGRRKFTMGNVQICNTAMELDEALSRSGAIPLEICIRLGYNRKEYTDVPSAIALLLNHRTSRRITSLEIHSVKVADAFIVPGRFPLLKDIRWYGPALLWTDQLFAMIAATSRDLETVKLPGIITSQLVELPVWSDIKDEVRSDPYSMARDLNRIARKLANLEGHFGGPPKWPNRYTPIVIWPHIRSLELRCCPLGLQAFYVPYLKSLQLEELLDEPEDPQRYADLSFPHLTTLKLTTWDARWLSRVSLPRLTTLDLNSRKTQSKNDTKPIFQSLLFPTVRVLIMGPKWNDTAVAAALESVPNLLILKVEGTFVRHNNRVELVKRLSGKRLCPRLESFSLGTDDYPLHTLMINIVPAIKQLIKIRKRMKIPFKEFTVWWVGCGVRSIEQRFI